MLFGILNLSLWGYVAALLIMTHFTVLGVTLYLHRCQTHRGLELHPIISHFFRFWLWLTTGMETKEWVAIHRKHHARCETEDDPHSPQLLGLKKVFWEGAELYRAEAKNKETIEQYGDGTPDDWMERHIYTKRSAAGVKSLLVINLILFGIPGLSIWALQMIWIPVFAAGFINGVGHYWGYRNFECPDAATNISPLGIFLCGEELHNNHHTYGTSAKFSIKPWEFDLGWGYIQVFKFFGLAKVKRMAPKPLLIKEKKTIDVDTISALLRNRFQVMANYGERVIAPVFREEQQKAKIKGLELVKRTKKLLNRASVLVEEPDKQYIEKVLEKNISLRQVYHFKTRLQEIWDSTSASQKELVEAIQEWCRQAEETGIDVLRDFAKHLSRYTLQAKAA